MSIIAEPPEYFKVLVTAGSFAEWRAAKGSEAHAAIFPYVTSDPCHAAPGAVAVHINDVLEILGAA